MFVYFLCWCQTSEFLFLYYSCFLSNLLQSSKLVPRSHTNIYLTVFVQLSCLSLTFSSDNSLPCINPSNSLTFPQSALTCHSGASIALSYLVVDVWDCSLYWWIFGLASVLPAVVEVLVFVNVLMLKKNV